MLNYGKPNARYEMLCKPSADYGTSNACSEVQYSTSVLILSKKKTCLFTRQVFLILSDQPKGLQQREPERDGHRGERRVASTMTLAVRAASPFMFLAMT